MDAPSYRWRRCGNAWPTATSPASWKPSSTSANNFAPPPTTPFCCGNCWRACTGRTSSMRRSRCRRGWCSGSGKTWTACSRPCGTQPSKLGGSIRWKCAGFSTPRASSGASTSHKWPKARCAGRMPKWWRSGLAAMSSRVRRNCSAPLLTGFALPACGSPCMPAKLPGRRASGRRCARWAPSASATAWQLSATRSCSTI